MFNNIKINALNYIKEYKHKCEKCQYSSNNKSSIQQHYKTRKHNDLPHKAVYKIHNCEECEYQSKSTYALKSNVLNNHCKELERKDKFKYYCTYCHVGSDSKATFKRHKNTLRHQKFKDYVKD